MNKLAILGATGNIGRAVHKIFSHNLDLNAHFAREVILIDSRAGEIGGVVLDLQNITAEQITRLLVGHGITHVINALPFFLNDKVAEGALNAGCNYIDFTEDDAMADKVWKMYEARPDLACAPKCGLAPGFINYLGHDLASQLDTVDYLGIRVGALPRNIRVDHDPVDGKNIWLSRDQTYALSWSVDGLVNEYIRPCQVRVNGIETEVEALSMREFITIDGMKYEARATSGGIGSLIHDLPNAKNVNYKTLRYQGHYDHVEVAIETYGKDFDKLKEHFLEIYPYTRDDVIVVYAESEGMKNGVKMRNNYAQKFYGGFLDLTGIQLTTAGGGLAVLELMTRGMEGAIKHQTVGFDDFTSTSTFKLTYNKK